MVAALLPPPLCWKLQLRLRFALHGSMINGNSATGNVSATSMDLLGHWPLLAFTLTIAAWGASLPWNLLDEIRRLIAVYVYPWVTPVLNYVCVSLVQAPVLCYHRSCFSVYSVWCEFPELREIWSIGLPGYRVPVPYLFK